MYIIHFGLLLFAASFHGACKIEELPIIRLLLYDYN